MVSHREQHPLLAVSMLPIAANPSPSRWAHLEMGVGCSCCSGAQAVLLQRPPAGVQVVGG
jgi:hypothetical protein